jgi:GxxExxY protein
LIAPSAVYGVILSTMGTPTDTSSPRTTSLLHKELVYRVVGAFLRVYDRLGFGFLEVVYRNALAFELERAGIAFQREVLIEVWDLGNKVGHFKADFVVENAVILEIKATREIDEGDTKQLLNYLRGGRFEVGLLLHFGPKPVHLRFIYTNDRKP